MVILTNEIFFFISFNEMCQSLEDLRNCEHLVLL